MAFEPLYERILIKGKKEETCDRVKVECKTDVSTDDVDKVLNVNVSATVTETTAQDGEIKYGGKAVFYICYQSAEGDVKKCENAVDFSGEISLDSVQIGDKIEAYPVCEKTEWDKGGLKLFASATISVCLKAFGDNSVSVVSGGEGLIVNQTNTEINKSFGLRVGSYPIEEEYELSYPVAEVIYQRATPTITAVQCGVGCIIVDGTVVLSSILLQSGDKKDIIKETKTVAYRAEIECEEAMPSCSARANVVVKSFKTDVAVDEEKGKSVVTALITLNFSCEAFCSEEISLIEDAFSLTENVKTETAQFIGEKHCEQKSTTVKATGKAQLSTPLENLTPVCTCCERAEVLSVSQTDGGLSVIGTLFVNGIYKDETGILHSIPCETSFTAEIDYPLSSGATFEVVAVADQGTIQLVTQSEVEICAEVTLTVYPKEKTALKYVKEVISSGEKTVNNAPISVYIPLENEELWSLAKRLNVNPSDLVETNKDLQFPLTGKERIVVYRQK